MGSCCSQIRDTSGLHEALLSEQAENWKVKLILVTGSPKSGKTTLLKQANDFHNISTNSVDNTFSSKFNFKRDIRQNCIDDIITLCEIADDEKSIERLEKLAIYNQDDLPKIADIIHNIWDKHKIQTIYKHRFSYGPDGYTFHDNMDRFFDNIKNIMSTDYIPSNDDRILCKTNYSGSVEFRFTSKGNKFRMVDIPHSLSKQINHCFEHVKAMIFVTSLTDYVIYNQDEEINQMQLNLDYFGQVCNAECFIETDVILFLNKVDLFQDSCIKYGMSLRQCFDNLDPYFVEYQNPNLPLVVPGMARMNIDKLVPMDVIELIQEFMRNDNSKDLKTCVNAYLNHIKKSFIARNKCDQRQIYIHTTNAIDASKCGRWFNDIQQIVVLSGLEKGS